MAQVSCGKDEPVCVSVGKSQSIAAFFYMVFISKPSCSAGLARAVAKRGLCACFESLTATSIKKSALCAKGALMYKENRFPCFPSLHFLFSFILSSSHLPFLKLILVTKDPSEASLRVLMATLLKSVDH